MTMMTVLVMMMSLNDEKDEGDIEDGDTGF